MINLGFDGRMVYLVLLIRIIQTLIFRHRYFEWNVKRYCPDCCSGRAERRHDRALVQAGAQPQGQERLPGADEDLRRVARESGRG